ncbi:Tim44/TimA family putative adaptor protein [Stagnihabitans tardus]|uniref:Tim44/TimA family putative adaptor protein n=1 Tax=Stagnihabitans tardus TaxID=2699202 RepID=A0AAE4Y8C8_9RHOB|nr:Tim44/TimA family putative adaptor protein [Stagnihabitans tardus]NBZ86801.1 Tim44/TimA family putative adaptor protein [Stagnihabitans tardus]
MTTVSIQLLVLAGIAVFLIIKLRSVLGTRDGFEPTATTPVARSMAETVVDGSLDEDISDHAPDGASRSALAAMKGVEPSFNVTEFLKGARGAYEMILMAYDKAEIDRIRPFIGPEVEAGFDASVADRMARGLTVTSSFMGIRELAMTEATFDRASKRAEISIRFTGEVIRAVKDAEGKVIEGNATAIQRQREVWAFARTMGAGDPNWQLVAISD